MAEVDPDDVGGAQQEERGRRQRSAPDDIRLHCPLPVEGFVIVEFLFKL